jgi:hypothetical protein
LTLLEPAHYRRVPWKNGGGISEEISAEGDGWDGVLWSVSRTGFAGVAPFSDLAGIDRIITVVEGFGLTLRARDGGADIDVSAPLLPVAFDGGRAVDGVCAAGPVRVVNVMGRRGRAAIAAQVLRAGEAAQIAADVVVLHACAGAVSLGVDGAPHALVDGAALRLGACDVAVRAGVVFAATIALSRARAGPAAPP